MKQEQSVLQNAHPPSLHTRLQKAKQLIGIFLTKYRYLILCALLPAVLVWMLYIAKGHHPFGDGCVLVLDLNGQYVWFFEALRNFVKGDADLLYSFSRALGGEFLGIYAYYVASPFSFLLALFPKERMLEGLLALFLLKTAMCGWSFGYYMHRTMKEKNPIAIIVFALGYAMSSYALIQQHNTMWIDAMMWLPLITLGIESLIKEGRFRLYTILLAITLFSNFYIGFMVCIYCAIYFFVYYFAHAENGRNNPFGETHHFLKSFGRIALYSVIAIGMASLILLSAYYSLNFGKTTFSSPDWSWSLNFDFLQLFYKFLPGSYDTVRPEGLPFVYCGVLTLLLLPVFFFSKRFSAREKLAAAIFILVLIFSFAFSVPDLIWHGFQKPNWLNYRYSFMLCFFLCTLACRAFGEIKTLPLKPILGATALIAVLCIVLLFTEEKDYFSPDALTCILFTVLLLAAYLTVFGIARKCTATQIISTVLVSVVCIEVFLSGLFNMNAFDADVGFSKYSYYNNFLSKARPIVQAVQESDTSFYRMEKTISRKVNDNMALNIRGLSGSTSTLNKETVLFLNKMGYHSRAHSSAYFGGNPVNDSLLGVKYILSEDSVYSDYYQIYTQDFENRYTAYYNPYALSIAYGADDAVLDFPLGFTESDTTLPTENIDQSAMSEWLSGVKDTVNGWLDIEETDTNATYVDPYHSPFERLNAMVSAMLGEEETLRLFVPIELTDTAISENLDDRIDNGCYAYIKENAKKDAYVTYTIQVPNDGEIFFYLPSDELREVTMLMTVSGIETKLGSFAGKDSNGIVALGKHQAGDVLELKLTLETERLYAVIGEHYFYFLDMDVFKNAMSRLAEDQLQITKYTEHSFAGTFQASRQKELVLTTIPYDKGWKITVDGQAVEPIKALGSVIAFYIDGEAGQTHSVELVYSPNTLWIGLTVSLISIGLLTSLILFRKHIMKIKILRAVVSVPKQHSDDTVKGRFEGGKRKKKRKANSA
ncbi:MAG: YfhO family protein [Clostridia bacterium]|nr:YfhO family protein [Clostridia bacterium]